MSKTIDSSILYKLDNGYRINKLTGDECSFIFRDAQRKVVAVLESCSQKITQLSPARGRVLTDQEKHILHKFIRAYRFKLNTEVAEALDLSILRRGDDEEEEYLSERQLLKRLRGRLSNVRLHVGRLRVHTLKIPSFSKGGVYNFRRAEIKKLIVEKNCDLLIDMRDNLTIEALRIRESFTGAVNMSRNTVESMEIGNNCRCDLTVYDSLRCFNLNIADVYSGNLIIKNSCFHALNIGYYCYAVIKLGSNWGRRGITIGNSFRGSLQADSVNIDSLRIGNDCKGNILISSQNELDGTRRLEIAEDFSGTLDLSSSCSLSELNIGRHARGRINLLGCPALKVARFDKYFSGYADFSESAVEYVDARYGCSGEMVFFNCENLALLRLPRDRISTITIERKPLAVQTDDENLYYRFSDRNLPARYFMPFYLRIYHGVKNFFTGEPN